MKTEVIKADSPQALETATKILREGGLVAFPTDTVYGVGALAFDAAAVQSIYEAKGRSGEKAIPVLVGDPQDLDKVTASLPDAARRLAMRFWPGPLTLVVGKHAALPAAVSATDTVGVRMPNHPVALALLRKTGPMAVTSANLSGRANPSTADEVLAQLGGRIGLIIDGGTTPGGVPSTVLDCTQPDPAVLRDGPVKMEDIRAAINLDS